MPAKSLVFALALSLLSLQASAQNNEAAAPQSDSAPAGTLLAKPESPSRGVEILSDTQGVDFGPYLQQWHMITQRNWEKRMPKEVNAPVSASGAVVIQFRILPSGAVMDDSVILKGRSSTVSLDHAAWSAITESSYPPLPSDFHGPYLELRAYFLYNEQPQ
jgi:hypothetical protein